MHFIDLCIDRNIYIFTLIHSTTEHKPVKVPELRIYVIVVRTCFHFNNEIAEVNSLELRTKLNIWNH